MDSASATVLLSRFEQGEPRAAGEPYRGARSVEGALAIHGEPAELGWRGHLREGGVGGA